MTEHPTRAELEALAALLPGGVRDLVAPRSSRLKVLGIDPAALDDDALLDLLVREPKILRRPIVTDGRRVVVGLDRAAIAALATGQEG
jgi:arsenate reductase-like glutaredoxin family protein